MERYLIQESSLEKLFNALLAQGRTMIAPRLRNGKIYYGKSTDYHDVKSDFVQTVTSAKEALFPRTENLFTYVKERESIVLKEPDLMEIPEIILWGLRPCDANGFIPLSTIFNWDIKDELFNRRQEKTVIISFSCPQSDEFCFCSSVGGGPGSTEGSDIQFTRIDDTGYLAEILTEKGAGIMKQNAELFLAVNQEILKEDHLADVPGRFDREKIGKKLSSFFGSEIWLRQSQRCLGCGACAFVCPACACFDIQDEAHGNKGTRLRCWDSCGFSLFTMHTSGHNPRENQSQRWRQRLLHKFTYMPERLSVYGCTGCGRCSRACPADMNILEHLISIQEVEHE